MASRLAEFRIDGLFGLYSHRIPLYLDQRITAIIGPNGRGKTVCLKFIEALFRHNFAYFTNIPFTSATFDFTGGEQITVEYGGEEPSARAVQLTLTLANGERMQWAPAAFDPKSQASRELRRYLFPSST